MGGGVRLCLRWLWWFGVPAALRWWAGEARGITGPRTAHLLRERPADVCVSLAIRYLGQILFNPLCACLFGLLEGQQGWCTSLAYELAVEFAQRTLVAEGVSSR